MGKFLAFMADWFPTTTSDQLPKKVFEVTTIMENAQGTPSRFRIMTGAIRFVQDFTVHSGQGKSQVWRLVYASSEMLFHQCNIHGNYMASGS